MRKIILASTSPRRKEIFAKTGLKFKTVASNYEEDMQIRKPPHELAKFLSSEKTKRVAKKYPDAIIIGVDTFIVFKNELLGKPHDEKNALEMLKKINGKTIFSISGFSIINSKTGKIFSKSVETKIFMRKLEMKEIENYVKTKEPLDKAGAFAIQGMGAALIKKIDGDFFNVMGLPLSDVVEALKRFGITII